MKILISGAGPAGLTIAYWLKRHGFTPTLIEQAPALRTGGFNLDIRGAATKVLRRMEIYESVAKASTDMQTALLIDRKGKVIHKMHHNILRHQIGDDLEIMRSSFCQILMDQIPDVEVIFGDSIKKMTEIAGSVKVEFKKNKPREFDLVIGADGFHSKVRKLIFGNESRFVDEFGIYYCIFTIPNYLNLDRTEMQYTEFGRLMTVWSSRGDLNAKAGFAFVSSTPVEARNIAAQQQLVRTVFEGIGGEVPKILEMMYTSTDFYFDVTGQIHMDQWSSGRIVLVGDAAYCPAPSSGQGLSLAIVGAYILAGELAVAQGNFQTAFDHYEQEMCQFVKINQTLGIESAKLFKLQEKKNLFTWMIVKIMNMLPGRIMEFVSRGATKNMHIAANSITLKDY